LAIEKDNPERIMSTKIDTTQHPMDLDRQKQVYEAIETVISAEQAWEMAPKDGTPVERAIVNALLNAGWQPPRPSGGCHEPGECEYPLLPTYDEEQALVEVTRRDQLGGSRYRRLVCLGHWHVVPCGDDWAGPDQPPAVIAGYARGWRDGEAAERSRWEAYQSQRREAEHPGRGYPP
jgi:hypothetical protein